MIRKSDLSAVLFDARLTPDACRVVLAVAYRGAGQHEIALEEFAVLLNHPGEKRLRRAVSLAERYYLDRQPGGRGHADRYTFSPAKAAGLNADSPADSEHLNEDSPAERAGLNPDSPAKAAGVTDSPAETAGLKDSPAKVAGLNGPHARDDVVYSPSSSSSSSSPRARTRDIDTLRAWLGPQLAAAADRMDLSGYPHPANWAAYVFGAYCRDEPTDPLLLKLTPDDRRRAIALALDRYAMEGQTYRNPYFRKFVQRAAADVAGGQAYDPAAEAKELKEQDRHRSASRRNGRNPPADETPDEKKAREERELVEAFFAEPENQGLRDQLLRQATAEADRRRIEGPGRATFVRTMVTRLAKERMREAGAPI